MLRFSFAATKGTKHRTVSLRVPGKDIYSDITI